MRLLKDKSLGIVLEAVMPGAGFFYLKPSLLNLVCVTISLFGTIFIISCLINVAPIGLQVVISWLVLLLLTRTSSSLIPEYIDKCNSNLLIENDKELLITKQEQTLKEEEISNQKRLDSNIVSSKTFKEEFEKLYNLKKHDIINDTECDKKKNELFDRLINYGTKETPEDFLIGIIELKNNNILSDEELNKLKLILLK